MSTYTLAQGLTAIDTQRKRIAASITQKGVAAADTDTLSTLADKVLLIQSGGGSEAVINGIMERTIVTIETTANKIGATVLQECLTLITLKAPNAKSVGGNALYNCRNLTTAELPQALTLDSNSMQRCQALPKLDLHVVTYIGGNALNNCLALSTLIIRTGQVCTLENANALTGTPIASGTGYIYVPSALVANYKVATNWTVYANQIRAIEDFTEITSLIGG